MKNIKENEDLKKYIYDPFATWHLTIDNETIDMIEKEFLVLLEEKDK